MSAHTSVLLLITLWASMEDGFGLPVMKLPGVEVDDGVPTQRVRTKRCSCSNLLDSECHYFCHLDIIWVNTPSPEITSPKISGKRLQLNMLNILRAAASRSKRAQESADSDESSRRMNTR
ncbi:hypothetical protein F7725_018668 [Dissostichus mawsoni]|uniref:Endothelin-like toxin domain-containing protein n=1 Tax=Dissostichus mawsoni TaxID=36200 RepID=A0A7J5XSV0_DISMA|nr:hypothetical protein F7725_018668 [Dissostichus mawsoni]